MFRLGGANSIQVGQRLDRCLRDIHTVNQHLAVSPVWWEKTVQSYFGLGLGCPGPRNAPNHTGIETL